MKPSLFSLLFLFALIASSAKADFLFDAEGDRVVNGGQYYILPSIWAYGGGLRLTKIGDETCPLNVAPSSSEVDNGLPWTIESPLRIPYVPSNTMVAFHSVEGKVPSCVPTPSKWTIVEGEDGTQSVKVGGYENTLKGWFKIQQVNSLVYKLVFCPTNSNACGDLGFSTSDKRLVVMKENESTMGFVFVKAKSAQVSKHRINNVLEA